MHPDISITQLAIQQYPLPML